MPATGGFVCFLAAFTHITHFPAQRPKDTQNKLELAPSMPTSHAGASPSAPPITPMIFGKKQFLKTVDKSVNNKISAQQ